MSSYGYVIMRSSKPVTKRPDFLSIGGFMVETKDGKEICFDWDQQASNVSTDEQGHLVVETNLHYISDCFEEDYKEMGIQPEDVNGSFLTNGTRILEVSNEIGYNNVSPSSGEKYIDHMQLVEFHIIEEPAQPGGQTYKFSQVQMDEFNKTVTV